MNYKWEFFIQSYIQDIYSPCLTIYQSYLQNKPDVKKSGSDALTLWSLNKKVSASWNFFFSEQLKPIEEFKMLGDWFASNLAYFMNIIET